MTSRPRTTLIKSGTVVTAKDIAHKDILIEGEQIKDIGDFSAFKSDVAIDASGLLVFPGAVDTHVHFNDEFMGTMSVHDYYTGTLAAAYGGVTSIIDFSNQIPGKPLIDTLKTKREEAKKKALVDWGVHPVITDLTPGILDEIPLLVKEGAPTIKCYMTYRAEGLMVEDEDLKHIMGALRKAGGMLLVHAEDNDTIEKNVPEMIRSGQTKPIFHAKSRSSKTEAKAIRRCIKTAQETSGRLFIVHMASDEGMDAVSTAQEKGLEIFAETCTHYLIFTEAQLEREDGIKWICSPPLRSQAIQRRLWEGVGDGTISMVSSDDAAFSWKAKLLGADRFDKCPNGIPGIEPRMTILYSEAVAKGLISLPRFVELVSTAPAQLFGLAPRKGNLAPGADADIVLFDPSTKWTMGQETLHMAVDWSAYEDIAITGKILKVFSRGELIIDGENCLAEKGRGQYLHRKLKQPVQ